MSRPLHTSARKLVAAAVLCSLVAASAPAHAIGQRATWGITLGSIGGAASLVADFGSMIYIVDREHTGGWGWLSLASGTVFAIGGISLAEAWEPMARDVAPWVTLGGVATVVVGIVGLVLPRHGSRYHALRRASLLPLLIPERAAGGLALGGVF